MGLLLYTPGKQGTAVDQGYTGEEAADAAQEHGIQLEVVKLSEAKRGFVLLPRKWVVNEVSRGHRAFAGSPRTTSGCPKPSSACISSPLSV